MKIGQGGVILCRPCMYGNHPYHVLPTQPSFVTKDSYIAASTARHGNSTVQPIYSTALSIVRLVPV